MRICKENDYIMCSDCGEYIKTKKTFIKYYKNTAICLCDKCAKKLRMELEDEYGKDNN